MRGVTYLGGQLVRYWLHDGGWVFSAFFSKKVFGTFWVGNFFPARSTEYFLCRYICDARGAGYFLVGLFLMQKGT